MTEATTYVAWTVVGAWHTIGLHLVTLIQCGRVPNAGE
jgi:hypothetical protein